MKETLSIHLPETEGLCCILKINIGDEVVEIEMNSEAAEAVALTLLSMVEVADAKEEIGKAGVN